MSFMGKAARTRKEGMLSLRGFVPPWVRTKASSWRGIAKTLVILRLGLVLAGGLVLEKRSLGVSQLYFC